MNSSTWCRQDHPRGCGEHMCCPSSGTGGRGSSPRMRGAPTRRFSSRPSPRIIPADAGSTLRNPCNPSNMIDEIADFYSVCILHSLFSCLSGTVVWTVDAETPIQPLAQLSALNFHQQHSSGMSTPICTQLERERRNLAARLYLLALLQPVRRYRFPPPADLPSPPSAGLSIRVNPSQSTGFQSERCTLKLRCCSLRAE